MTIINSAVGGSRKQVSIEAFGNSKIEVRVGSDVILVSREDFAQAAISLGIDGLIYRPPIKVPKNIGAIVRNTRSHVDWVRGFDGTWFHYRDGAKYADHDVQQWLNEGDHEIISEGVDA